MCHWLNVCFWLQGWGTVSPFVNLPVSLLAKFLSKEWHLHLTGVTTAQLRGHMSNMNRDIYEVTDYYEILRKKKKETTERRILLQVPLPENTACLICLSYLINPFMSGYVRCGVTSLSWSLWLRHTMHVIPLWLLTWKAELMVLFDVWIRWNTCTETKGSSCWRILH